MILSRDRIELVVCRFHQLARYNIQLINNFRYLKTIMSVLKVLTDIITTRLTVILYIDTVCLDLQNERYIIM